MFAVAHKNYLEVSKIIFKKIQTLNKMELPEMTRDEKEEEKKEDEPEQYHHERTNSWKSVGFIFKTLHLT